MTDRELEFLADEELDKQIQLEESEGDYIASIDEVDDEIVKEQE